MVNPRRILRQFSDLRWVFLQRCVIAVYTILSMELCILPDMFYIWDCLWCRRGSYGCRRLRRGRIAAGDRRMTERTAEGREVYSFTQPAIEAYIWCSHGDNQIDSSKCLLSSSWFIVSSKRKSVVTLRASKKIFFQLFFHELRDKLFSFISVFHDSLNHKCLFSFRWNLRGKYESHDVHKFDYLVRDIAVPKKLEGGAANAAFPIPTDPKERSKKRISRS